MYKKTFEKLAVLSCLVNYLELGEKKLKLDSHLPKKIVLFASLKVL